MTGGPPESVAGKSVNHCFVKPYRLVQHEADQKLELNLNLERKLRVNTMAYQETGPGDGNACGLPNLGRGGKTSAPSNATTSARDRALSSTPITERIKAGECSCETMNPKGSCCLADVKKVVKMETKGRNTSEVAVSSAGTEGYCSGAGVCDTADSPPPARRTGLWAVGGSLLSAVLASACCWLPLTFLAFGVSAAGLSSAFEQLRPVFLGATSLFLITGFYFAYFRKDACASGEVCAVPNPRLKRFNRVMLWVATVVVAGVALFPNYASVLMGANSGTPTVVNPDAAQSLDLRIEGMTCAACSIHVQSELERMSGVTSAAVSYDEGRAQVIVDPESPATIESLVAAVEKAGYMAHAAAIDEKSARDCDE